MTEDLKQYGLSDHQADEMQELKAPAEARGLNWITILSLLAEHGPTLVGILKKLLDGAQPQGGPAVNTK